MTAVLTRMVIQFSGIAFAFSPFEQTDVASITDWPGSFFVSCLSRPMLRRRHLLGLEGHVQPKIDTLVCCNPRDKTSFTWGAHKNEHGPLVGMKLLLDPDQEQPLYVPQTNTKAELRRLGKPVNDVAAGYIISIYAHAMNRIHSKIPKEYLDKCQRKFVVSVPAV